MTDKGHSCKHLKMLGLAFMEMKPKDMAFPNELLVLSRAMIQT